MLADKNFDIYNDSICHKYKDKDCNYTCRSVVNTFTYINMLIIGYRLDRLYFTIVFLIGYIMINGYPSIADDDLSKYTRNKKI